MRLFREIRAIIILSTSLMVMATTTSYGQISPGELSEAHSALEGMSNCTQCHILGSKVSDEKCLDCHKEIKARVDAGKGYHSSAGVKGKSCVTCHNDHHGRTFEIIRFEEEKFDHTQAGYKLEGAHAKKTCKDCHKSGYITDPEIKKKKYSSYLGLSTSCLSCHEDYHQQSLSGNCLDCHSYDAFKPASKFDHNRTKFQLAGKHQAVDCAKCHKIEVKAGKQFQKFSGLAYSSCSNCHTDVHKNQFGQDCRKCHSEESFHAVKGMENFDHSTTGFILEEKHRTVGCKNCHKTALTDPVKHDHCYDCHADYHKGELTKDNVTPDCSACHSTRGFSYFNYTLEQHGQSTFPLEGAHMATPCTECHKKTERWSFRNIGSGCNDCHTNIHDGYIDQAYYPESDCRVCHSTASWKNIAFDHSKTRFELKGAHQKQSCHSCHFSVDTEGKTIQKFSGLYPGCTSCHKDNHAGQFEMEGITNCMLCHDDIQWKPSSFDHNTARFRLDGKHKGVACDKCHKTISDGEVSFVQYRINQFKCESCHQ